MKLKKILKDYGWIGIVFLALALTLIYGCATLDKFFYPNTPGYASQADQVAGTVRDVGSGIGGLTGDAMIGVAGLLGAAAAFWRTIRGNKDHGSNEQRIAALEARTGITPPPAL